MDAIISRRRLRRQHALSKDDSKDPHAITEVEETYKITKWQRGEIVGSGSFGKVYSALDLVSGQIFACKQVAFERPEQVTALQREIELLSTLRHPNIVKYLGCERDDGKSRLNIFLEYCSGGSIKRVIQRFGPLSESVIRRYTRSLLKGLAFLHSHVLENRMLMAVAEKWCPKRPRCTQN